MKIKTKVIGVDKIFDQLATNLTLSSKTPGYQAFAQKLGGDVVERIKQKISAGVSPVDKIQRYAQYKNRASYPGLGAKAKKPSQPVNLNLTGDMLKDLTFSVKDNKITIGFIQGKASKLSLQKAATHNEGTQKNVARRQMLPTKKNQVFKPDIMALLRTLYSQFIRDTIRR